MPGARRDDAAAGRWRPGRLNTLCDGVFAIAMTLLALGVRVPDAHDRAALQAALPGFFGRLSVYALAFFIIGQYWQSHHRAMRWVRFVDQRVVRRTLALLAGVASLPIAVDLITGQAQYPEAVAVAAGMLALTSLLTFLAYRAALRPGLAVVDPTVRHLLLLRTLVAAALFALAAPVAYLLPDSSWAPLTWWGLAFSGRVAAGVDALDRRLLRRGDRAGDKPVTSVS